MKLNSILRGAAGLALGLSLTAPAMRAADEQRQPPSLAEKTSEALKKLPELQNAKNFPGMLQLIDSIIPQVPPTSYDAAFLLQIKAKILLQMDQIGKAIDPWEQALKLYDQHQYFDEKESNEIALYLAQLIFSEAGNIKDPAAQQRQINRALAYLKRHLDNAKKPSIETQALYAQLLYQQAVADSAHINKDLLNQALTVVDKAMLSTLQPKEPFYMLKLAILQQQNEIQKSGEILELIVKKFPGKKDYWPLLMATYLNLASQEKDPDKQREWYVRAINTIERAQALGYMKTPKDNYNLVTIYITAGQFSRATDILHAGLKSGTIESSLANWRVLGSYYQQANRELQAIDALREAAKLYPQEGMLDLQIGEIYRQLERTKDARDAYAAALAKGKLEKPNVAWQLLAYTSMELDDWLGAQRAINEAMKFPESQKDPQLKSLADHINNTIKEREEQQRQKEEDMKKKKQPASL